MARRTPQKIASVIASGLAMHGIDAGDPEHITASRRTSVGRGHRVKEWVMEITAEQTGSKPILVIVRIADTRPTTRENQYATGGAHIDRTIDPDALSPESYSFDASGLPLRNERN
jgi:hypothetical protein